MSEKTFSQISTQHTSLLPYVQQAPDQGKTGACLFMASTGAMELLTNRKYGIINPEANGTYDLSEPYLIHAPTRAPRGKSFFEGPIYKFNGQGVHIKEWPFNAWNGTEPDQSAWTSRDTSSMPRVNLPKVKTHRLFNWGERYATYVLNEEHIQTIKSALHKYNSPILINYNDNDFWHAILIVGYDDQAQGECYQITPDECDETTGSFYVRDSFGKGVEVRDYDWFKIKGNAAFVIMEDN